jgi:hypothetical protein
MTEAPEWATDKQRTYLAAVAQYGSNAEAERRLGLAHDAIGKSLRRLASLSARKGHAPGHFNDGVAPGYAMGKVTIQRGPGGVVERVWERQSPEQENLEALIARCEERVKDFPKLRVLKAPKPGNARSATLTNFLGLFDLHIGEKISSDDPAGRWDIATAKRTIKASVDHAILVAPKAKRFVLCFGGDAIHYDGLLPVTPKSRHVLHSDGDFDDMVDAVLEVATYAIDQALLSHEEVYLIWAEGNHDEASSVWMRKMLARIYSAEPRLTVVQSKIPYYALQFGQVMIGVHHGHKAALKRYAGIFANMFRQMWGSTTYAYGHRGHEHHIHEKEQDGMVSTQHPALPPSDDYASGMGLVSRRGCHLITYDDHYGEVGRTTVRPEMLGVFDEDRIAA